MKSLSIIIPTLNRKKSLITTLNSYTKYLDKIEEIIVVDQSDENIKYEIEKNFYKVKYIHYPYPSSTKARNIGIKEAKGDILIFSDDDIEILDNTLENIEKIFMNNSNISMIGGLNIFDKKYLEEKIKLKSFVKNFILCLIGKKNFFKLRKGHITGAIFGNFPLNINNKSEYLIETEWAMGFFFACKREYIERWNIYFDENLISYAYAEDLDFSYRYFLKSKKENLKVVFSKEVWVYHHCSLEYRIPNFKKTLVYFVNRKYISYKLNKGFFSRVLIEINDIIFIMIRVLKKEKPIDCLKAKYLILKFNIELKKGEYPKKIKEIIYKGE